MKWPWTIRPVCVCGSVLQNESRRKTPAWRFRRSLPWHTTHPGSSCSSIPPSSWNRCVRFGRYPTRCRNGRRYGRFSRLACVADLMVFSWSKRWHTCQADCCASLWWDSACLHSWWPSSLLLRSSCHAWIPPGLDWSEGIIGHNLSHRIECWVLWTSTSLAGYAFRCRSSFVRNLFSWRVSCHPYVPDKQFWWLCRCPSSKCCHASRFQSSSWHWETDIARNASVRWWWQYCSSRLVNGCPWIRPWLFSRDRNRHSRFRPSYRCHWHSWSCFYIDSRSQPWVDSASESWGPAYPSVLVAD